MAINTYPPGAWIPYTTTWAGTGGTPSIGNGTLDAAYTQIGKTVVARVNLAWNSTTTGNASTGWTFTLPVAASATKFVGAAWILDNGTAHYSCIARLASTTTVVIVINANGGTAGSTIPMNPWATGDSMQFTITYEAA